VEVRFGAKRTLIWREEEAGREPAADFGDFASRTSLPQKVSSRGRTTRRIAGTSFSEAVGTIIFSLFFSFFSKEKRFKGVVGVAITTFDFLKKQHLVLKSSLMIIKKKS
jgi:hypothetical protein